MENDVQTLQALLKEDPSNFQARRELSIILVNNGFNEEAEGNLEYLCKYFPDDAELHYNLGIVYEKLKKFDKAREAYEKAIEASPQEDFYYNLGEVLVDLKDFQKAVSKNPKDVYAYFYLGYIYQDDGLTNFAIESYKKVLEVSPDYSWAYFNLGSIAFKNGNDEEAKEYLKKTIQYNPQDYEAYKLLIKICIKNDEAEDALELLHTALDEEANGDLYYCLARVYKFIGDLDEYYDALKSALNNPYTLSYPKDMVKREFESAGEKLGRHEDIEPERTVEEYSEEDFSEEDSEEYEEEDSDDEDDNDDDEEDEDYEEDEYEEYDDSDESDESDQDEDDYEDNEYDNDEDDEEG